MMIKSTVQLGQMSAAQRLDEVFGLPRGSAVIALNDPDHCHHGRHTH